MPFWRISAGQRMRRLWIKLLFLFRFHFAHKKYSRSFIKLRLNTWCHMDYFTDLLATFLDLDSVRTFKIATFMVWVKTCYCCFWVCCFKCKWAVAPGKEGGASRAELQAPALAVLVFANKHSTISTSLLSLQKTLCFKISHLIILFIIHLRLWITQMGSMAG